MGSVSDTSQKSIMIMSTCGLLFRDFDRSRIVSINWVSLFVKCLLRKPWGPMDVMSQVTCPRRYVLHLLLKFLCYFCTLLYSLVLT